MNQPGSCGKPHLVTWLTLLAIIVATTGPFLTKAFHIDDPLYIAVARQILRRPWDPYGAELIWEERPELLFDADFNPPLWNYLMAAVLVWSGEPEVRVQARPGLTTEGMRISVSRRPEICLHLLESLFVALALVALFLLARRLCRWPLTATALVAFSPALLPGQNVMLEGPTLAFWLWATVAYLRAFETNSFRYVHLAGLLAACGVLTKYSTAVLLLILAAHAAWHRRWRLLHLLLLPAVALALWTAHNYALYGRSHLLTILARVQTGEREPAGIRLEVCWGRAMACLRAFGALSALFIPAGWLLKRSVGSKGLLVLLLAALAVGYVSKWEMGRWLDKDHLKMEGPEPSYTASGWLKRHAVCVHALAFGTLGTLTVAGLCLASRPLAGMLAAGPAERLLWLWLLTVILFCIVAVPFLATRHLLPAMIPLTLLLLRRSAEQAERQADATGQRQGRMASRTPASLKCVLAATLVLTATCGFLVAKADYDFAEWYRHLALGPAAKSAALAKQLAVRIWFTGHWGWAYYAERAGLRRYIHGRCQLQKGDLVLLPLFQTWRLPPRPVLLHLQNIKNVRPRASYVKPSSRVGRLADLLLGSVRTLTHVTHYYAFDTKSLPWRFCRSPLDEVAITEYRQRPVGEASRADGPSGSESKGPGLRLSYDEPIQFTALDPAGKPSRWASQRLGPSALFRQVAREKKCGLTLR